MGDINERGNGTETPLARHSPSRMGGGGGEIKIPIMRISQKADAKEGGAEEGDADSVILPAYETLGAAGMDLRACHEGIIVPGAWGCIPTGIAIALPEGFEAQIRSRSGLALKYGVACLNAPGTIDSDYRGEIKVILINHGGEDFIVKRDMRIAQMVIAPVSRVMWEEMLSLPETRRGVNGFGSSGVE